MTTTSDITADLVDDLADMVPRGARCVACVHWNCRSCGAAVPEPIEPKGGHAGGLNQALIDSDDLTVNADTLGEYIARHGEPSGPQPWPSVPALANPAHVYVAPATPRPSWYLPDPGRPNAAERGAIAALSARHGHGMVRRDEVDNWLGVA